MTATETALHLVSPRPHGAAFGGNRLLTATHVAEYLQIAPKKVYALPIPRVQLSQRRVRFLESDVLAYVQKHRSTR